MMDRRSFIQSAFYSSLLYGAGSLPKFVNEANAAFQSIQNRTLINTFLDGGPDMRHLVVPAYDSNTSSFGYKYWSNRWQSHDLSETNSSEWQARWENDYFPITVGGQNWGQGGANLVDSGLKNNDVTFGIWKEAGWLIDMFLKGHVALAFNVAGGRNRAHDTSSVQLHQGNILSDLTDIDRSGWGGRVARSAQKNIVAVTSAPLPFCFGPEGLAPDYDPNAINNLDLISVQNSREMGLNSYNLDEIEINGSTIDGNQRYRPNQKLGRSLQHYYAALRQEQIGQAYEKFMDHELKIRGYGELIRERLETVIRPDYMNALVDEISIDGVPYNPDPNGGAARNVLHNMYDFGRQMMNLYDVLAVNDILDCSAISMRYGGWDTHEDQRQNGDNTDLDNPDLNRGIENNFKDLFGGPFSETPDALHGGFSALWESLGQINNVNRDRLVFTYAGEFGRQIRANGGGGTDHGTGNLMITIGEDVNGGVYGRLFPDEEIELYDQEGTPDIVPLTDIDYLFAPTANWVAPGSSNSVFPRLTNNNLPLDEQAIIEPEVSFDNLFKS